MKFRKTLGLCFSGHSSSWLSLSTITLCFISAGQALAQDTWDGGGTVDGFGNYNWVDGNNWVDNGAPTSGVLNFGGVTNTTTYNNNAAGTSFGAITLTNNGTAGQTNGFTLNGNSITLNGNINTTAISAGGSAINDVINLDLILNGNRTIGTNGVGGGSSHNVTVNGNISEIGGARNLTKGGAFPSGTLTLTGNNSYTGLTVIETGTVIVSKIADSGNSNLGYGNLRMGFGGTTATLNYTGSGNTTGRTLQIGVAGQAGGGGGATITANGTNGGTGLIFSATNFTAAESTATAASRTLTLGGSNTDANQISGIIADVSALTKTNLTKANAGLWILAGANNYTGSTTVSGGVLRLDNTAALPVTSNLNLSGGVLGLGAGDFAMSLGTAPGQAQITATGAGFAAYGGNRTVNLSSGAALSWGTTSGTSTTGFFPGDSLVLGSSTATHTVEFQNPVALAGTKFFRADDGSAAVDGRLSGAITGSTTFSKAGTGTLELSNTSNAWTGITYIDSGTLKLGADNVLPGTQLVVKKGNAAGNSSGALDLAGFNDTIGALNLGAPSNEGNANTVGQTPSVIGTGTLTLGGTLTYEAGNVSFLNGQATISAKLATGTAGNRDITVGNGSAATDLVISGAISGATITKLGTGTLEISSSSNTYTGNTNVNAGTLVVNGNISTSVLTTVNNNGTLGGTGTVGAASVVAGGTLAPGNSIGTLNFSDTLTLAGIANFEIDPLLGLGLNTDRANVTNGVTYGGTLNVIYGGLSSNFANGMIFNLFDASAFTGSFSTVNLPTLTGGLTWQNNLATNGTLAVVPEPTVAILLSGLGTLVLVRRRRA